MTATHTYRAAFTIVELLVVIAVLGILAAVVAVGFGAWRDHVVRVEVRNDLVQIAGGMEGVYTRNGSYPVLAEGTEFTDSNPATKAIFAPSPGVTLTYAFGDKDAFCVEAVSKARPAIAMYLHVVSDADATTSDEPRTGTCADIAVADPGDPSTPTTPDPDPPAPSTPQLPDSDVRIKDIAFDSGNTLYVLTVTTNWSSEYKYKIYKVTPAGAVSLWMQGRGSGYRQAGTGLLADIGMTSSIDIDTANNVYLANQERDSSFMRVTPGGVATIMSGNVWHNWSGSNGYYPVTSIAASTSTNPVYFRMGEFYGIRRTTQSGTVSNFKGSQSHGTTYGDHGAVVVNAGGTTIWGMEMYNSRILRYASNGTETPLAGVKGTTGCRDGAGAQAWFALPRDIALAPDGNIYVADTNNHAIRRVTPAGVVSTFAGACPSPSGYVDATGAAARFTHPGRVAADSDGNIFVTDGHATANGTRIRKITPAGAVSTFLVIP